MSVLAGRRVKFFGTPQTAVQGSERDKTLGGTIVDLLYFLQ